MTTDIMSRIPPPDSIGPIELRPYSVTEGKVATGAITLPAMAPITKRSNYIPDNTEKGASGTTWTTIKTFRIYKSAALGLDWKRMKVASELLTTDGTQTAQAIVSGGGLSTPIMTTTTTTYALRTAEIDVSGIASDTLTDFGVGVRSSGAVTASNKLFIAITEQ